MNTKRLLELSVVASMYVVLTLISYPLAYGMVQFRISEVLVLLCFYRKDYGYSLIVGCFIANLFSPEFPVVDAVVGSFATFLAVLGVMHSKNIIVASIYPVILNGIIIGVMLNYFAGVPLFLAMAWVALGQFVVITIIGVIIFKLFEKNPNFMKLIKANQNYKYTV